MAKGTVARIVRGQFGFIKPDDGGEDVYFRLNWVKDAPPSGVAVDMRVEYETRRTPKGLQTRWVRAITPERRPITPEPTRAPIPTGYRFLNPYNFVRPLSEADEGDPLLGRCPPPPHDRYLGLTGRITCTLEAVTPLFVSDSHEIRVEVVKDQEGREKEHPIYRFFRYDGEPAIPATSLRGPIRSVFEAATNSCFSVFAGRRRLSYHFNPRRAPELVPARVEKNGDGWKLRLLTGTSPLQVGRTPRGRQYAAWLYRYWPMQPSGTLRQDPPANRKVREFQEHRRKGQKVKLGKLKHGDECYALLEPMQHPFPRIQFWDVIAVSEDEADLQPCTVGDRQVERGWLCLTNQNIEPKHSERFFFRADDNTAGPTHLDLPQPVAQAYEDLIADYQERHSDAVANRVKREQPLAEPLDNKDAGFSRFIYTESERKLEGGELVYAYLSGPPSRPSVEFIVPVSVPRVGYEHTIGDLLSKSLHACEEYHALCPACRTFGWVYGAHEEGRELPQDKITAYAGRVQFGHAHQIESAGTFDAILSILSSPKPTTTRFYLKSKEDKAQDGWDDEWVNYDAEDQVLRGRKFYRHHGDRLSEQEYRRTGDVRDDQNRSVEGVQQAGSTFTFEVRFENLAPLELGALLWALEMEGWRHRIGLGKPLGFGSATVTVTGLEVLDPKARYGAGEAGWVDGTSQKEEWLQAFKTAMAERYGASSFEELPNVRDLRALLAESPDLPVHYPRTDAEPLAEGKNYEWFMGNKRAGRDAGPRLTLRLAEEDVEGLPLLDKYGRIQRA